MKESSEQPIGEKYDDVRYIEFNPVSLEATQKVLRSRKELQKEEDSLEYLKYTALEYLEKNIEAGVGRTYTLTGEIEPGLLSTLETLKNKYGCIISTLPQFTDVPSIYGLVIRMPKEEIVKHTDGNIPSDQKIIAVGFSDDKNTAVRKAIGEFRERLLLIQYRNEELHNASIKEMQESKKDFINPLEHERFTEEQRNKHLGTLSAKSEFRWGKMRSLVTHKEVYVPAQFMYWTYNHRGEAVDEPLIQEPNSNGAASGMTREAAITSALKEVIERDAFLLYWLNQLTPKRIDPYSAKNKTLHTRVFELEAHSFNVYLLDVTTEFGIPVVACVLVDETNATPAISVGASCDFSPEEAALQALREAEMVYTSIRTRGEQASLPKEYEPFQDPRIDQVTRMNIWANPNMKQCMDFFLPRTSLSFGDIYGTKHIPASDAEAHETLTSRLTAEGEEYEPYAYITTTGSDDLPELYAVQVFVPALISLYLYECHAPIAMQRIKEAPQKLGQKTARTLNSYPHPFS